MVLPVPFTPTTRKTCGRCARLESRSAAPRAPARLRSRRRGPRARPRAQSLARSGPCEPLADARRHRDAEIGLDQDLFEPVERLLVELPLGEHAGETVGQRIGGAGEPAAKLIEPAPLRLRPFPFAHDCTAISAAPSSPATTASTSAPGALLGLDADRREIGRAPVALILHQHADMRVPWRRRDGA